VSGFVECPEVFASEAEADATAFVEKAKEMEDDIARETR
jgi:hypothetical protein